MNMTTKTTKKHHRLRNWLPWHAFDGMGLDWREHSNDMRDMSPRDVQRHALILVVVALVIATCAAALAMPHVALLIDIVGGLAVATVVLFLTGQWQELHRGLRETGQWSGPGVQFGLIRQYILNALVQAQECRRERRAGERKVRPPAQREEGHG